MRYAVIYADCPWSYTDKCAAGKRGAAFKYRTMTPAALKALPVGDLAAPDCALFSWATLPMLPLALDVMAAWGFTYKTVAFTWIKRTRHGKLFWGMGNWTRANAEYVLLGVKGKPARVDKGVHSIVEACVQEHSRKPSEVRNRIVRLMGDVPRLELFARGAAAPGWDVFGDQADGSIVLTDREAA